MTGRPPLPVGFGVRLDRATRVTAGGRVLLGGAPWRLLRVSDAGARILAALVAGGAVEDAAGGRLARRLVDAGLGHPVPPPTASAAVTVVVPVFAHAADLDGCLAALGPGLPVVVVDDGSPDAETVAAVAARHGARLLRLADNRGPAAARNAGLAVVDTAGVAFVDADSRVDAARLRALATHLADPCVAAAAPRVRPAPAGSGDLAAFAQARSPLDMGERPARVHPAGPVRSVPSTVLVAGRDACAAVGGFDESLRFGEDVDLVWRLIGAGWTVRYDPSVVVAHVEPRTWSAWLRRRYRYGTSAGPLATRHPGQMAGPVLSGLLAPVAAVRALPRMRAAGVPVRPVAGVAAAAPLRTAAGVARWALPLWWPLLVVAARRRAARPLVAAAASGPALADWLRRRPPMTAPGYLLASLADDAAYGAGVWRGCARARVAAPLVPRLTASRRTSDP